MNERDIELAKQAGARLDKHNGGFIEQSVLLRFATLIRADERKHLEAELLKLKDGVAASGDYIQGRWDLIGEFQDVIRARGQHD